MPQRDNTPFRKRCLALSVAALCTSLGACSTVPREEGGFGGAVAEAGEVTRVAGARLWDRTRYLLGFSGDGDARPRDTDRLDEVDLAMMEEDAVMPGATDVVRSTEWSDITAASEAAAANESLVDEAEFDAGRDALALGSEGDPSLVTGQDMTHEVGAGETLWDVAKRTTGDATNWHVLADVNDLSPDATVYPGQVLVVPADMVRPELAGLASTADAPETGRLAVPEGDGAGERLAADVADLVESGEDLVAGAPDTAADALPSGGSEVRLEAGETLWDFAKRTTGDATNWRAIAEANGFSEERATKVREGESIAVPTALLRDGTESSDAAGTDVAEADGVAPPREAEAGTAAGARDVLVAIADAPKEDASAEDIAATDAEIDAADGEASRLAAGDPGAGEPNANEPVRIVEAAYRAEPESVVTDSPAAQGLPSEIMVSGTYYPKAVYNDADFSSSLLMRVSPGTTLQVSRAVGPWYEVTTDQGTGYVHARDIK